MKIGIDVGYGYVKAINEVGNKITFPALVAPGSQNLGLVDVFKNTLDYQVSITTSNGQEDLLIGEAAKQSFIATQVLSQQKPKEYHDPLLFTAAHLLGADDCYDIGVGLPLVYYTTQKDTLKQRLKTLKAYVTINGRQKYIQFTQIQVIPQGAGILFTCSAVLPDNGFVGLVDIGTYTTEYLLFQYRNSKPIPVLEGCGTVEAGVHFVYSAIAREFQSQTGSPLPTEMEQYIVEKALNREPVTHNGKKYFITDTAIEARRQVAQAITQKILAAWGNRTGYLDATLLAGGGSLFFDKDLTQFPNQHIVSDPVYANAQGYLALL
jgi:plasmid segregation protein ParM